MSKQTPSYRDGEHTPLQQIRRSRSRSDKSIFIVRSFYTRTYKDGNTAIRYAGEFWSDGNSREDDIDSRSAEVMYPVLVFNNIEAPEPVEDK